MSARSLRSGIIKTGDSIQRATRQNTSLYKTETGFQQARQVDRRYTRNLMPVTTSLKRKRRESSIDKLQLEVDVNKHNAQSIPDGEMSPQIEVVPNNQLVEEETHKHLKERDTSEKRKQPRMSSLNAIAKVNALSDNYIRCGEKKYDRGIFEGLNTVPVAKHRNLNDGKIHSDQGLIEEVQSSSTCRLSEERNQSHRLGGVTRVEVIKSKSAVVMGANMQSKINEKDNVYAIIVDSPSMDSSVSEIDYRTSETLNMDDISIKERAKSVYITQENRMLHEKIKHASNDDIRETNRNDSMQQTEGGNVVKCTSSHSNEQEICSHNQYKVDSKIEGAFLSCCDNFSDISDSESVPYEIYSPESCKELGYDNLNKNIEMSDQAVQTDVNNKYIQTDVKHLPNLTNKQLCTCKIKSESNSVISLYSPINREYLPNPFYVNSTVLAHTNNHTLVVPMKKKHMLKEKENYTKLSMTKNISNLLDTCINNTLLQNMTCTKLIYLANYQKNSVILNTPRVDWKNNNLKCTQIVDNSYLQVPEVSFRSLSGTNSKNNVTVKNNLNDTLVVSSKQKVKSPCHSKKCNGWQFEGDPMEESYTLGAQVITRRHYQSLRRNNEVLQIHDAVMLKSGLGKCDSDYLARISMFWEDTSGAHAGDMMMSIYWYYKPEQTNFKLAETSKMEVYASRHRDDNSVACIVDKCYVISITQFCRFQAQKMLLKERREKKLKVVPEHKNVCSRLLPSPDVDESIVYFCRYGYEYRCGKLIKGL